MTFEEMFIISVKFKLAFLITPLSEITLTLAHMWQALHFMDKLFHIRKELLKINVSSQIHP